MPEPEGEQALPVPAGPVVGWVGGVPVRAPALDAYLAGLAGTAAGERLGIGEQGALLAGDVAGRQAVRSWGSKALLADLVLAAEAARLGIGDPSSFGAWAEALETSGELAIEPPSEAQARSYHAANAARFTVPAGRRVRHLLLAEAADALAAREELDQGADLGELAAARSLDLGSRARRGDLGWVEPGQLAGALEAAIFAASLGALVGPLASPFGWHLLRVEAARRRAVAGFEACRAEVLAELAESARRRAARAWLDEHLAAAVRVPAGAEHPLSPGLPGSVHRH